MKLAIMQPYFFPYIGYFQLMQAVDKFVIYDNIEFTKKGWINRNKLVFNGQVDYFTINIKKDSDYLNVNERVISNVYFDKEIPKILNKIKQTYSKAPYFQFIFEELLKPVFTFNEKNLFNYLYNSLEKIMFYLEIETELIISSKIEIDHDLKNKFRVFEICHALDADIYLNPPGGKELYSKDEFQNQGVKLEFLNPVIEKYDRKHANFHPYLSIIDVMMFNSPKKIRKMLENYELE
ncbi:MAG: WbqC family protein [bacterium]